MKYSKLLAIALSLTIGVKAFPQAEKPEIPAWDNYSDTWVATDGLGRVMPGNADVGDYKYGKQHTVGIFYVTWHEQYFHNFNSPLNGDVTKILNQDPTARMDNDNSLWNTQSNYYYHWGEPESGYFLSSDKYVIRRDISMLADAGVDVLILDCTNGVCYWDQWTALFEELEAMKAEGNRVPKVCWWCFNTQPVARVQEIYAKIYELNKYKDLWFYWYGKPLILTNMTPHVDAGGSSQAINNYLYDADAVKNKNNPHYGDPLYTTQYLTDYPGYIKNYFTMRNMWFGYNYWNGKRFVGTEDNWSFGLSLQDLSGFTAKDMTSRHNGALEEFPVTPAQHANSLVGKCWTRTGGEPELDEHDMPVPTYVKQAGKVVDDPTAWGIYFQDRWDEALSVNPQFIYLNDWNEWTAMKFSGNLVNPFMRRYNNGLFFVDQYNAEFNRTIGPAKGTYSDNYYMQMASNIRKYKGARAIPENYGIADAGVAKGDTAAWNKQTVEYRDTRADITHRDFDGYGGLHYTDNLGRNDIVRTKVAMGEDSVYFRVETADALSGYTGNGWMLLFIDADKDHSTGWNGYDYVINKKVDSAVSSEVMSCTTDTADWKQTSSARIAISGNTLLVAVAKADLGLSGDDITFDFKWVDHPRDFASFTGISTAGDAAPNRRFNYRYIWHRNGSYTESEKDKLIDIINQCIADSLSEKYAYGTDPGMVADSNKVNAYTNALENAYNQAGDALEDDAYKALRTTLEAARDSLLNAPVVPVTDGCYYIVNASAENSSERAMYITGARSTMIRMGDLDRDNTEYMWMVSKGKNGYNIRNVNLGKYITRPVSNKINQTARVTNYKATEQIFRYLTHNGQVAIYDTAYEFPLAQRNSSYSYVITGEKVQAAGGAGAWRLMSANDYFIRKYKQPLDSLISLAVAKLAVAEVKDASGNIDPASPAYNAQLKPVISAVSSLVARDTVLSLYSITQHDIDTLSTAYNALAALWPDSTKLNRSLSEAAEFLATSPVGTEVGNLPADIHSALQSAYDKAIAMRPFYKYTLATLDSLSDVLDKAVSSAVVHMIKPSEDAWYIILSADTTITDGTVPGGKCLAPQSNAKTAGIIYDDVPEAELRNMRTLWRFVNLGDTAYALQNAGTGWYLGSTGSSSTQVKMGESPVPYSLAPIAAGQWRLTNLKKDGVLTAERLRKKVSLTSDSIIGKDIPSAWTIVTAGKQPTRDSLSISSGSLGVLTLPYEQSAVPASTEGNTVKFYRIVGSKLDENGKTISIDLSEYTDGSVPAGYPLVYLGTAASGSYLPILTNPAYGGDVTNEGLTDNGLVGTLVSALISNDTCGYFSGMKVVPVTVSNIVNARTGYVKAAHIANLAGYPVDLTVEISGSGLVNSITSPTMFSGDEIVDVYSTDGILLRQGVKRSNAFKGLPKGVYVIGGEKYIVK